MAGRLVRTTAIGYYKNAAPSKDFGFAPAFHVAYN
jgi:hypothetical protein